MALKCYCRMRVSMGTTRMWSLCVLMLHPLTWTSLMDPLTWFSPTGFSCISLTKRYNFIFLSMRKQVSFLFFKWFCFGAGGAFGRKDGWLDQSWRIHFLPRILLPPIWWQQAQIQPHSLPWTPFLYQGFYFLQNCNFICLVCGLTIVRMPMLKNMLRFIRVFSGFELKNKGYITTWFTET